MPIKPDGRNCTACGLFKPWALFPRAAAQKSGHRPRCIECHRKQCRLYAAANSERNSARGKAWSKANRARARERERVYKATPEVRAKTHAYWRTAEFRLRATEKTMRRKALIKNRTVERVDYAEILRVHGRICNICQKPIGDAAMDFDHVRPLAKGGEHSNRNVRPSHASCNRRKRDTYAD